MSASNRRVSVLAAVLLVAVGGGLAWRGHLQTRASADPDTEGAGSGNPGKSEGSELRRRHEAALHQQALAKAIVGASEGITSQLPALNRLSVAELQALMDALAPEMADRPASYQVFCYQTVLGVLLEKDPEAALTSLDHLNQALPPGNLSRIWLEVAGMVFSAMPAGHADASTAWLKEHQEMIGAATAGTERVPAYPEIGRALALRLAHEDLDSGLRAMDELGLPAATILPTLARQTDSPQDWGKLLADLHQESQSPETRGAEAEILNEANSKIGQMSAQEGRDWLASVAFSSQDLVNILTTIEAGPIQDPQPWFDWMKSRLSPAQAAQVRKAWSDRSNPLSADGSQ